MTCLFRLLFVFCLFSASQTMSLVWAQAPAKTSGVAQRRLWGQFLTDSIEIGRPFQYALTYRHSPKAEVLFPDTSQHFFPFRVKEVSVWPTKTVGEGARAVSRDSAVYTLISFETDSIQVLQVPIRLVNVSDCTYLNTQVDTVFLRSHLTTPVAGTTSPRNVTLASETKLTTLQQQFNYPLLGEAMVGVGALMALIYLLFGQTLRRKWTLYQLYQGQQRFIREYNRLIQRLDASTASETANQAIVMWKSYLEQLEGLPYASLTTPEIAERTGDDRVADALREADRMIYGGEFSVQSSEALIVLRNVAVVTYQRQRFIAQTSTVADTPDDASEETESTVS